MVEPRISVVMCTKDRAPQLADTLERWNAYPGDPNWELVLVDNGSSDDSAAVAARVLTLPADRWVVLREPRAGAGYARNTGWRAARGALVLFTDDDCYPSAGLLGAVRACFTEAPIAWLGGMLAPYDAEDASFALIQRTHRVDVPPGSFVPAGLVASANLTVDRAALEATGGFDPAFGAGTRFAAEDAELVARLAARGYPGAYDPRPVVYHHHRRRAAEVLDSFQRTYDRGRGAYYAKCLLDPTLRAVYVRRWLKLAWRGSWRRTGREIRGGLEYLWWRRGAGRRPGPVEASEVGPNSR